MDYMSYMDYYRLVDSSYLNHVAVQLPSLSCSLPKQYPSTCRARNQPSSKETSNFDHRYHDYAIHHSLTTTTNNNRCIVLPYWIRHS